VTGRMIGSRVLNAFISLGVHREENPKKPTSEWLDGRKKKVDPEP
jgi:hypothetical protein